jgi:hypothetical protein
VPLLEEACNLKIAGFSLFSRLCVLFSVLFLVLCQ